MRKLLFSFFIFIQILSPLSLFPQNSEYERTVLSLHNDTTSISKSDSIAVSNQIDTTHTKVEIIKEEIKNRDLYDSTRENSPLKKANDAIIIDTTHLNISGQVNKILEKINNN